jgi:hypothetical protein
MIDSHHRMLRSFLFFGLSVLLPAPAFAQDGKWGLAAFSGNPTSIIIVGSTGGSLSGAYRITNDSEGDVRLCINKCPCEPFSTKPAKKQEQLKNLQLLRAHNSIDLFVNSCLSIEEFVGPSGSSKGTSGTYENLSYVSAP